MHRRGPLADADRDAFSVAYWHPEDAAFWRANRALAWRTLILSSLALHLSFAVWFTWSALVVRLPGLGFKLSAEELFWLPAAALLAGALSRFPHALMVASLGGMWTCFISTLALLVPILGIGLVVKDPTTPFAVLLFWAAVAGFCAGGQIASSSANLNLWVPGRLGGTALGINGGLGNLGITSAQLVIPVVTGAGVFGALAGAAMPYLPGDAQASRLWPQNAAYVWLLPTLLIAALIPIVMRNQPPSGRPGEQLRVLRRKHCWLTSLLYALSFGTYSGFAGAAPMLLREVSAHLAEPPDPLAWAWLGPLVGALARPLGGVLADRLGGANVSMIVFVTLTCACFGLSFLSVPSTRAEFEIFAGLLLFVFVAAGIGNASVFKQIVTIFPPAAASGVLGFATAAALLSVGVVVPILLGYSIAETGGPDRALYVLAGLYLAGFAVNGWFYHRRGAEAPC